MIGLDVKVNTGGDLEVRELWRRRYMAALAEGVSDEVRATIAKGLNAAGQALPTYRSGAREGQTVTLRATGETLDGLGPVEMSDHHVVIAAPTERAKYLQRFYDVFGITDQAHARSRDLVEDALEAATAEAEVRTLRRGRRRGRPVSRSRRRFR